MATAVLQEVFSFAVDTTTTALVCGTGVKATIPMPEIGKRFKAVGFGSTEEEARQNALNSRASLLEIINSEENAAALLS